MNDIVDTALLFDYEYMREKIREKLGVRNINEITDVSTISQSMCPLGITIRILNEYNIRMYFGLLNHEKNRTSCGNSSLILYTDTNVKVHMSSTNFINGGGVNITFSSDDGKISCSGYLQPGHGRLSCDLTPLKNATPYIDPAIYLDYLMCCPSSEVANVFTKHEPLLARLMEENAKLWDEVVELKEENIRLSKYNKTLEMKNANLTDENGHLSTYIHELERKNANLMEENACLSNHGQQLEMANTNLTEENNGWIESERISKSKMRYMKEQIEEFKETLEEKQTEIDRTRYMCIAVILYFMVIGVLAVRYLK